ncbi:phenylacetate--CoA ligase family protein [Pseudomonas sp. NPDC087615]|uniref:phenylacetate--CoA ligase family protein n=1 Tax=Pseudomonas sp. NPDC087615 TaxID=3364443 RepID=UPI0038058408
METTDPVNELITFVRQHSHFYGKHFADIPEKKTSLAQLPLIDPVAYWSNSQTLNAWPVLTGPVEHALVFKTGGSTSAGKLSVYTQDEWRQLVSDFGDSLNGQFKSGDRVANLFFAGDLYASFLFIHDSLAHVAQDITEFPFTGDVGSDVLAEAVVQHSINVLAGLPAHLLTFASWLNRRGQTLPGVDTLLYGGESLFASQRQRLHLAFPSARISSIGYASVDAGFIGASHHDCVEGEHRMRDDHIILEIIDEQSGEVIDACDQIGVLVLTHLKRRLMPLIRYPVGDRACWREPVGAAQRKFALRGRSANSQRVRLGILSLIPHEIGDLVRRTAASDDWQLVIEQSAHKDVLSLKWVPSTRSPDLDEVNRSLKAGLIERYPLITQLQANQLLDLHTQSCTLEDLPRHPRSGKCLRVLDRRRYEHNDKEAPDGNVDPA